MNPYLPEKAEDSPGWHKPVFWLILFLTGLLIKIDIDFIIEKDWSTAVVGMGLIALCAWPVVRIAQRWYYGSHARKLADIFMEMTEESVSFKQLNGRLLKPDKKLAEHVKRLLEKRNLQNLYIDYDKNAVVLAVPSPRVQKREFVQMECPNCGAKNQVIRGRVGRCAYCESPLIYKEENQQTKEQKQREKKGR